MRKPKIVVHQGRGKKWYVTITGGNGEKMSVSEGYTLKHNAVRAAQRTPGIVARAEVVVE